MVSSISSTSLLPLASALNRTTDSASSSENASTALTDDPFIQSLAQDNPSLRSALAQLNVTTNVMDAFLGGGFNADNTSSLNNAVLGGLSTGSGGLAAAQFNLLNATYIAPIAEDFQDFLDTQGITGAASVGTGPAASTESFSGGVSVIANSDTAEGQYSIRYNETQQTFTLTEGAGDTTIVAGVPSSLQPGVDGQNAIDFGNGISLSFDDSFDRNKSVDELRFSISY